MTQTTARTRRTHNTGNLLLVEDAELVPEPRPARHVRARLFALFMLGLIATGLGYVSYSGYRALSDSFVAPLTLSPDSDLVISSKLKLDELSHERAQAAAELQGIEAELRGNQESLAQLRELQQKLRTEVAWLSDMNAHKTRTGAAEISTLQKQSSITTSMLAEQQNLTHKAEVDLKAGLITRMDYARELQRLGELQRGLLDTQRSLLQGRANLQEINLNARGLDGASARSVGPQRLASEEQLARVGLEMIRLESDVQRKVALSKAALDRFGQIDKLVQELKSRPVFKAIEQKLDLAFVPYSQLDGVAPNAIVHSCRWGILLCERVGRVSGILQGEVNQPDPWGIPARGQYAVLQLSNHQAARAKTLRVRMGAAPVKARAEASPPLTRTTPTISEE